MTSVLTATGAFPARALPTGRTRLDADTASGLRTDGFAAGTPPVDVCSALHRNGHPTFFWN
jgi:hypothetical protein